MINKAQVFENIHLAFGNNTYPGDDYLLGSTEGSEPLEEVQPFIGREKWSEVPVDILDKHSGSLNFFSEAGYRFFLPAYLVADLNNQLLYADPLFTLIHGFSNLAVEHEIGGKEFVRKIGKDAFMNPKRFGGLTFEDYARYRLSIFSHEEASAIVSYLEYKRDTANLELEKDQISAALDLFWFERAQSAPEARKIEEHLREEEAYLKALLSEGED